MTPLHMAAEKGDRLDIVEYLLHKGADINIRDSNGVSETILYINDPTGTVLFIVHELCCLKEGFISLQASGRCLLF